MKKYIIAILLCFVFSPALAFSPAIEAVIASGSSGGVAPTLILDDSLVEASDTAIASHTVSPGPGGAWSLLTAQALNVGTDGAKAGSTASSLAITSDSFTNGYVTINAKTGNALDSVAVCARFNGTTKNGYCAYVMGNGTFNIQRLTNLSGTVISTVSEICGTHVVSTNYDITITVSGSSITASYDGCTRTATDATYASGSPGIRLYRTSSRIGDVKAYEND